MLLDDRKTTANVVLSPDRLDLVVTSDIAHPKARVRIESADGGSTELHWRASAPFGASCLTISPSAAKIPSDIVLSVSSMPSPGCFSNLIDLEIYDSAEKYLSSVALLVSIHVADKAKSVYLSLVQAGSPGPTPPLGQ